MMWSSRVGKLTRYDKPQSFVNSPIIIEAVASNNAKANVSITNRKLQDAPTGSWWTTTTAKLLVEELATFNGPARPTKLKLGTTPLSFPSVTTGFEHRGKKSRGLV